MKKNLTTQIRHTAVCIATAIVIAGPGLASAAFADRAQSRIQMIKTNATIHITNVRENRPLAKVVE